MGSNAGDSESILRGALLELGKGLGGLVSSSVYRTSPRYVLAQPDFYNLVARGSTDMRPAELLEWTQAIEARHGRDRSCEVRKGPRTLDIDILLYGDEIIGIPGLDVPHPGMLERAFVLVPLVELAPGLRHPSGGKPFASYVPSVAGQGIYLHAGPPV